MRKKGRFEEPSIHPSIILQDLPYHCVLFLSPVFLTFNSFDATLIDPTATLTWGVQGNEFVGKVD